MKPRSARSATAATPRHGANAFASETGHQYLGDPGSASGFQPRPGSGQAAARLGMLAHERAIVSGGVVDSTSRTIIPRRTGLTTMTRPQRRGRSGSCGLAVHGASAVKSPQAVPAWATSLPETATACHPARQVGPNRQTMACHRPATADRRLRAGR